MVKQYYPGRRPLEGISLELFSEDDLRSLHYATMDVFINTGIQVSDAEARAVFKEGGCLVDEKTQVVKIPEFQ